MQSRQSAHAVVSVFPHVAAQPEPAIRRHQQRVMHRESPCTRMCGTKSFDRFTLRCIARLADPARDDCASVSRHHGAIAYPPPHNTSLPIHSDALHLGKVRIKHPVACIIRREAHV